MVICQMSAQPVWNLEVRSTVARPLETLSVARHLCRIHGIIIPSQRRAKISVIQDSLRWNYLCWVLRKPRNHTTRSMIERRRATQAKSTSAGVAAFAIGFPRGFGRFFQSFPKPLGRQSCLPSDAECQPKL